MIRRCSHPHCNTSLDEYPIECPHLRPFCEYCTWEEGCSLCAAIAVAWDAPRTPSRADDTDADWVHELRAEQRNYEHAQLIAREEERRAG